MGKSRKREPAKRLGKTSLPLEHIHEMHQRACAFRVAATQLRNLDADPSNPDGYGIFNAICVNAGYAMELYLKVLCHIHSGNFVKTHMLATLHSSLPEIVQSGLEENFCENLAKFGGKVQTVRPFTLVANKPTTTGPIPFSFAGYMHEFDRSGMTARRYPEDRSNEIELDFVHQALVCAVTLEVAAQHHITSS
ncbi:hypothetical protein [Candidatus Poriferisodalis sp.]|uniref:hypothetical protein n=1 Tax=Candidatus Poriferisodalis sp. TaxID=3101277 RepID=UPI003B528C51